MKNHNIICREFLQMKVIHQSHSQQGSQTDQFLFSDSQHLCLEGFNFILKIYANSNTINHETNLNKTISFFNLEPKKLKYVPRDENKNCSCYVVKAQIMQ